MKEPSSNRLLKIVTIAMGFIIVILLGILLFYKK
jgi:hypothetical protein